MTSKNTEEFMEALRKADPFVDITDEIDNVIASLRVVWLALQSKEWLDDMHIEHCAYCIDSAVTALMAPRDLASGMATVIQERARAELKV